MFLAAASNNSYTSFHQIREVGKKLHALRGLSQIRHSLQLYVAVSAIKQLLAPPAVADRVHERSCRAGVCGELEVKFSYTNRSKII